MASKTADHKKAAASLRPSKKSSSSGYRDDPDAVSMHTTRSDYEYDDLPELPSYSDSVAANEETVARASHSALLPAGHDQYASIIAPTQPRHWSAFNQSDCTQSPSAAVGNETSIRMDEALMRPEHLYEYVKTYLRNVPPRPCVRIQGWHWQTMKKEKEKKQERVTDFDIVMNLQKFLPSQNMENGKWIEDRVVTNGEKAYRGSFRKMRMKGYTQGIEVGDQETPDLRHWCREFCEDKSRLKIFRVERKLLGLNEQEIREGLEDLVRSTHYRGHIDISFPVGDRNVDIYSPHWINRARISWVRWIFYLTFLFLITWPILFFMTKRWAAFSVCWKFSSAHRGESGQNVLTWASLHEKQWLQKHKNLLLNLVLEKFQGDGTDLPTEVEVRRREVNTGNTNMDSALRFMQGGVDIWNSVSGQGGGRAGSEMGWGMDSRY